MAFIQSRKFNFFTYKHLTKNIESTNQQQVLTDNNTSLNLNLFDILKNTQITCCDAGGGKIFLGDNEGFIYEIDQNFKVKTFRAFDFFVTTIQKIIQNCYLVTSGSDELISNIIKIWNLDKIDQYKQTPSCIRTIKIDSIDNSSSITSVVTTDLLTLMCIGFDDGNLISIKGDLLKEKTCKKKKVSLSNEKITGIFLKGLYQNKSSNFLTNKFLSIPVKQNRNAAIFLTTSKKIFFGDFINDDEIWKEIESEFGSDNSRCCCLINDEKHSVDNCVFILGNEKAVYFFQNDGPRQSLKFKGEKVFLHWYKDYLIVITKEIIPFAKDVSTIKDFVFNNDCTIYDIQNKYIAFSSLFSEINQIVCQWNSIFLILKDGNMIELKEKDMESKLNILFKKQQYSLAIELAKKQKYDFNNLKNIFKQYGDHLYKKGEYENAINQYIKSIENLEPSFVIRKYLKGQKIKSLSIYLLQLHELGYANKDHTNLLIGCLTELKEKKKLNDFIKKFSFKNNDEESSQFDIKAAIKVLRKSRLYDEALLLCENHQLDDFYIKIQIEDKMDTLGAINFIEKKVLQGSDFLFLIKKYAKVLFNENPNKTTQLLKKICELSSNKSNFDSIINFYLDILNNNRDEMIKFLEFLQIKNYFTCKKIIYNTLLELYLECYKEEDSSLNKNLLKIKIMNILVDENSEYDIERAMLLCQIKEFNEGNLYLYEKLKLYDILLSHYIENNEDNKIIELCKKYGNLDNSLWTKSFTYFSKLDITVEKNQNNLLIILDEITKKKLLSLIYILKTLSNSKNIPFSIIKNYLIDALTKENELITENENLISKYNDETEKICKNVENLELNGKVFQSSKCSICNSFLDLPNVNFLCIHSFHLHCFQSVCGENENECPLCMPEHRKIIQLSEANQKIDNLELIEKFIKNINQTDQDSFSVVSNYFSKNIFE